jgi:hypothetical protein
MVAVAPQARSLAEGLLTVVWHVHILVRLLAGREVSEGNSRSAYTTLSKRYHGRVLGTCMYDGQRRHGRELAAQSLAYLSSCVLHGTDRASLSAATVE